MANAFNKGILRSIKGSMGRFIALVAIVALGAGFYAGLRMTCPDMKLSADMWYDDTNLMDIRIVSTLGLTDDDIEALSEVEGVLGVMGAYEVDIMVEADGEGYVMRVHSLSASAYDSDTSSGVSAESDDENYINRLILTEGRWPTAAGECVISSDIVLGVDIEVGDTITVLEVAEGSEDMLVSTEYVVVGKVTSSYYATSSPLGTTSLGSGSIQDYIYVCEEEFTEDTPYTEIFITVEGAADVNSSTDEYDEIVDAVVARIEELAEERAAIRTEEVLADAQDELDEATEEYETERADAEAELADAQDELDDAADQIADAQSQLAEGQSSYAEGVSELASSQTEADEQLAAAEQELEDAQAAYDEAMETRAELVAQLEEAESGLEEVEAGLEEIESTLSYLNAIISQLETMIDAASSYSTLSTASVELAAAADDASEGTSSDEETDDTTDDTTDDDSEGDGSDDDGDSDGDSEDDSGDGSDDTTDDSDGDGDAGDTGDDSDGGSSGGIYLDSDTIESIVGQLSGTVAEQLATLQETAEELEAQYDELLETQAALESAISQLEAAIATIDEQTDGVAEQIAAGYEELAEQESSVSAQLADAQQELDDAAAELAAAQAALAAAQAEYEEGSAELAEALAEAEEQFAEAEAALAEAQEAIDAIGAAEWYVMTRDQNYGVASFEADADRIDSIAALFPLIFFLVAALVALTTMTRMVEEERILIGTYKALGYSRGRIAWKYLCYALSACVLGCVLGISILSQVLPAVIMYAYSIIYFVPIGALPLDPELTALAAGLSIGIVALTTLAAVLASLREKPAALMLPRAPKAGKRILLERVKPLWSRMSFSWKVTCRNIFRDKKRFVMTVVGIAGCTALLLTGLGLSDAINDIIDKQFGDILRYTATIVTEDDLSEESRAELEAVLADEDAVSDYTYVGRVTMSGYGVEGDEGVNVNVVAASDVEAFDAFFDLRTRLDQEDVELTDAGVLLSEKLADKLGVEVGDTIELVEQDTIGNPTGASHTLTVTGIFENYIYDYAIVGPDVWETMMGEDAVYETVYAIVTTDQNLRDDFSEQARSIDGVTTVTYIDETIDTYESMLASVNMIVVVLVVAAAALAFIVVYNLTNINIAERVREIATLKVLGFTKSETEGYIYRETILLSMIGAALGLVFGTYLESFVSVSAEVDQVMFGRIIHPASFVLAFVLTIAFTAFVMFVMRKKISSVDMVESLKSNE